MNQVSCLETALWLESMGCSVIPLIPGEKRPLARVLPGGKWQEFQNRRATQEEIRTWFNAEPNANIALVCGAISGVIAVDVDGSTGHEWFKANMPKPNMFQFTSSEHKFHAFYRHPGGDVRIPPSVKLLNDEIDVRGDGSYVVFAPSLHPSGRRYKARMLDGFTDFTSLVPVPDINLTKNSDGTYTATNVIDRSTGVISGEVLEGERNNAITSLCGRLFAKGETEEDVLSFAKGWNLANCNPPLSDKEIQTIVHSMINTHGRRNPEALNADGFDRWFSSVSGEFGLADVYRDLSVKYQKDKEFIRGKINHLLENDIIESCGKKNGYYRKVDRSVKIIDINEDEGPAFAGLWLPFSLHYTCEINQKNIIVIAGETNSGKTGLLFNIAWTNKLRYKINYLTSEMTAKEIRDRIDSFQAPREEWRNVIFKERTKDFADAIDPDAINIVDFLEIYEDFSKIGAEIKKIFDRLRTGIAFIAIQKKKGEMFGRGGEFTLEKARLSLSLFTHGRLSDGIIGSALVTKCKAYRNGKNPEGKERFYQLKWGYYYDQGEIPDCLGYKTGLRYWNTKERETMINNIQAYCKRKAEETKEDMSERDFYD